MKPFRLSPANSHASYLYGAYASFACALCFVVGFVMILFIEPGINLDPQKRLAFIRTNGLFFQFWFLIIFVLFGANLMVLARAIRKWMEPDSSAYFHLSVMFGFVWAAYVMACGFISIFTIQYVLSLAHQDQAHLWSILFRIQTGLGDGVEWVGGVWMVMLSKYLIQRDKQAVALHGFGLAVGVTGCLTVAPGLAEVGAVFGMVQIVWFVWMGFRLLRLAKQVNAIQTQTGVTMAR